MASKRKRETGAERTERLTKFVRDYCDGQIFTDRDCGDEAEIGMCFPVLVLTKPTLIPKNTAIVYEYYRKAAPVGVNGKPIFFSCSFMNKADWERVVPAIKAELERRKTVVV